MKKYSIVPRILILLIFIPLFFHFAVPDWDGTNLQKTRAVNLKVEKAWGELEKIAPTQAREYRDALTSQLNLKDESSEIWVMVMLTGMPIAYVISSLFFQFVVEPSRAKRVKL